MGQFELIAIFGPTGIGKTELALALSAQLRDRDYQPVAVSADALQVYRGLELLTGVPSAAEQVQLEHRLLSFVDPRETFSAGRYAQLAHAEIDGLIAAGKLPIVVGGTGLYLRAAVAELSLAPPPPPELRARWQRLLQEHGARQLHTWLAQRAPAVAATVAPTDSQRIVRSLELAELGALGEPRTANSQLWTDTMRRPTLLVGLTMERQALYARIERRIDQMVAAGAAAQVAAVAKLGAGETASKALGFQELLAGDVDAMKRHTRAYARRQLTWMRKLPAVWTLELGEDGVSAAAAQIAARFAQPAPDAASAPCAANDR